MKGSLGRSLRDFLQHWESTCGTRTWWSLPLCPPSRLIVSLGRHPWATSFASRICVCAQLCLTLLQPRGQQPDRLLCPWDSPGKTTAVGCHFLLHGVFLTQGSNPCLLRLLDWQSGSLPLAPPGKVSIFDCSLSLLDGPRNAHMIEPWLQLCQL